MRRRVVGVTPISTILLFVLLAGFPVGLMPILVGQAIASDTDSFTLVNGVLLTKDFETISFQNMVININGGVVISDFSQKVRSADAGSSYEGICEIILKGIYSTASGMSGQYTFDNSGTYISKGGSAPVKSAFDGTFSGPSGLSAGRTITISFGEGNYNYEKAGGDRRVHVQNSPSFEVSFTVAKEKSTSPQVVPVTGSNQSPAGVKGDYNGDGKVTELDALAALKMSVGSLSPVNLNLDLDGNGKVTAEDARLILKKAVGK